MKRKSRKETVTPTLPYAVVETALARVYGAQHVQRDTFRGRLKNFRKLGMPQHNPGKGARVRYGMQDVYQLMMCLEIAEFGIDPSLIVKMVRHRWATGHLPIAIAKASELHGSGDNLWLAIPANFMSWTWGEKSEQRETQTEILVSYRSGALHPVWEIRDFLESQAATFLKAAGGGRVLTFNLSARIRDIWKALDEENAT
jgi:hypothetical protein